MQEGELLVEGEAVVNNNQTQAQTKETVEPQLNGGGEGEQVNGQQVEAPHTPHVVQDDVHEPESEETSPAQHSSSGYASDGSGAGMSMPVPMGMPTTTAPIPPCPVDGQTTSIQSDPQQSAFRPAMPGGQQLYHGMDQHQQQMDYQFRQNGMGGPQMGGMTGPQTWGSMPDDMGGYAPMGMMAQPPHHLQGHPHQMHQPIARRPITGNVSSYPSPGYGGMTRPQGHYPTSPGPHQNQYMPSRQGYTTGPTHAPPATGWGSPSWSGNGPPSGPPPMSMTPPPLSWNQGQNRRPPSFPQNSRNKPFGNVQYGNQPAMMQNKMRSKNYPFPTKTLNQDCTDEVYGSGRLEGQGGPLDNMRALEHYLPDPGNSRGSYADNKGFLPYGNALVSVKGGKSPSLVQGMGEEEEVVGGFGPDGSSSGFYGSSRSSPRSHNSQNFDPTNGERFSRKVFVGGLPPDIDEDEITASFRRFGPLVVDWPHKAESKSYFPPKGYAFLLFQDESSVQQLIESCIQDEDKLYLCVSSPTIKDKPVQIRPWKLSDADFVLDATLPLDPRKTVFVGGVPRPLKAVELAMIMDRLYGGVCYAGIDTDPELKYPKGAGRVAFSNQQSYIAAISARFVQLQHGEIDKRVEVKPYVLDDQLCDECQGGRCGGKFAPFFCANVTCLQYYCEQCWSSIHSRPGREFHKPLVKEGADRPRAVPFRWC